MKQKFLKDLGIGIDDDTMEDLKQFDLNGFLDEISDNRLKEENEKFNELTNKESDDNGDSSTEK